MKRRLFSIVFGDAYIDRFERACVLSLGWPKNRAALKRFEVWDLWTIRKDEDRLRGIAAALGVPVEFHRVCNPDASQLPHLRIREMLVDAMRRQLRMCCAEKSGFMWISPDLICGDGSVGTVLQLGEVPGFWIAVPTLRVDETGFLEAMGPGPLSNAQLVSLAFKHLHPDFLEGEQSREKTNAWHSGVTWRSLGDGLYAVTHLMPSAFLCQPVQSHVDFWEGSTTLGDWDHSFPQLLVRDQVQRVVGSSDAAFFVELTPPELGRPPLEPVVPGKPDRYRHDSRDHIKANRNTVFIWRAG